MTGRVTVVVSGLPAAGKTTLAAAGSDALGLPLLSVGTVKEASPRGSVFDIWVNPTRDEDDFLGAARGIAGPVDVPAAAWIEEAAS